MASAASPEMRRPAPEPDRSGVVVRVVVGLAILVAGAYLTFAAAVLGVVALTDVSGFLASWTSVGWFLVVLASGIALDVVAVRTLGTARRRRRRRGISRRGRTPP